ncbi:MAG: outer membrane beta-barrel protein [Bacteroidales bacterium]|nr:outer membrane beta-barrel protein [Bacteroidales bacterium]
MKRLVIYPLLVIVMVMIAAQPTTAQVRFGVRGGLTLGKLKFDRDMISSDNRVGWSGGVLLDLNIPVLGLGIEASALYTHRNNRLADHDRVYKRDYLDIPVYARYRLSLPAIQQIVAPLVFTGPDFSILFSDNGPVSYKSKNTYMSWDVGGGVDLFQRLRITLTYGLGMSRAMEYVDSEYHGDQVHGKDNHWTLSAAVLF